MRTGLLGVVFSLVALATPALAADKVKTAILVDKKTSTLSVCEYQNGEYKKLKTYHATMGRVKGDKEEEGDLKTPEGIYVLKSKATAPALARKFGSRAFNLNYPNTYDELAGRNGSHIMLHATDTPDRLNKDYDSQGCVVVNDEEIREIEPHIRIGLTPILIFSELTDDYLKPGQDPALKGFFESWVKDWESKDVDAYISHYHSDFKDRGKNRDQYLAFKKNLTRMYKTIEVNPEDVLYFRHPKYSMITFTQNYKSTLKGGGWGHRSRGTKILYIAEEDGKPKIIAETYSNLMW